MYTDNEQSGEWTHMQTVSLSLLTAASGLLCGSIASVVGGAAGGVLVGGKALGNALAGVLGGIFGPLAGVTGVAIGLLALMSVG
jgi:hypothetical protein